jgi:alpha-L-fucosidase
MGYCVLTTRHHDGFSLWPSAVSDWSVGQFLPGRDLVREYVDAVRSEGLRVGFYYSLSDWHHPDYPAFTEADKPYSFLAYRRPDPDAWARYLAYVTAQITELLTDYGPVDVLWFDGQWERTPAEWRSDELVALIRELQPDCLINDRLPGGADFTTPEQFIPSEPPEGRWETCLTMNRSWGYVPVDDDHKSSRDLVHALCETAGRGGNLLLNVSPRGDGSLPPEQVERLEAVGGWLADRRESIVGTEAGLAPWQFYGPSTRSGDTTFLHLLSRPYETVTVRGLPIRRVESVRHVPSGRELRFRTRAPVVDEIFNSDPRGEVVIHVPDDLVDDLATTIAVTLSS